MRFYGEGKVIDVEEKAPKSYEILRKSHEKSLKVMHIKRFATKSYGF